MERELAEFLKDAVETESVLDRIRKNEGELPGDFAIDYMVALGACQEMNGVESCEDCPRRELEEASI